MPWTAGTPSIGVVGRASERESLTASVQALRANRAGKVVLVAGAAGIGKTTLVLDTARAAHEEGAIVLLDRSNGMSTGDPEARRYLLFNAVTAVLGAAGDISRWSWDLTSALGRPADMGRPSGCAR
jgi:ATP/maltotriose-dependent transcriptional regulator MalT